MNENATARASSTSTPFATDDDDIDVDITDAVFALGEEIMGVTDGLCRIADAINNLALAVREHESP